jgi:hypothetical protein
MGQKFDFEENRIAILLLRLYRDTTTRPAFLTSTHRENALSDWNDEQLKNVWNIFQLIHTDTLEEMFRNYIDLTE